MTLTLRPTGLASPAYEHREDWTILEDGREVGRMYEDGSASTPPELTLEQAKGAFRRSWERLFARDNSPRLETATTASSKQSPPNL